MVKMKFNVFDGQACLFYWHKDHRTVIVLLYVDDILITGNCEDKINETKRNLCRAFKMKDLGEPKRFLDIEISRDRKNNVLKLTQTKFIDAMVEKFGLQNRPGSEIPMRTNRASRKTIRKRKFETSLNLNEKVPFREAVGALLYCTNCTRPDIAYAVNLLARKCSNHELDDWLDVEKVLKYLLETREIGTVSYTHLTLPTIYSV